MVNSDFGEASGVLVDRVQTVLDPGENAGEGYGTAPIGHVVHVRSAVPVAVEVRTTLSFAEGYGWNNLKTSIGEAVEEYLLQLRQAWADSGFLVVRISQIESRILAVKGVVDIADTRLNGTAANVTLGQYEIPVMGGVSG